MDKIKEFINVQIAAQSAADKRVQKHVDAMRTAGLNVFYTEEAAGGERIVSTRHVALIVACDGTRLICVGREAIESLPMSRTFLGMHGVCHPLVAKEN